MSFKTALGSLFLFGNDSKNSTTCLQMKLCLQRWCKNAQTILDGEETLFPEFTEKDEV
jgi:hypothetical protein